VTVAIEPSLLPAAETASAAAIYTAPRFSPDYALLDTTVVDATHVKAQTTHFSTFVPAVPGAEDGGTDAGVDAGSDEGSTTGTTGATGTGGTSSGATASGGSGGSSTAGGTGTGTGTGTGGSVFCPSSGDVGCGTLSVYPPVEYDDFVWETASQITIGDLPGILPPQPSVPAMVFGDPSGAAKGYTLWVALPSCPAAEGVVTESAVVLDNPVNTSGKQVRFTATVDVTSTDGGLSGTIQGQAGTSTAGISATFAFSSSGDAGVCVAPPVDLPIFGPASSCSPALDAGCSASTSCLNLADGGDQPSTVGTLVIDDGQNSCVSTYAPISVTVSLAQGFSPGSVQIEATAQDGGTWDLAFDLSCCPSGLGTLPATAYFYVNGCGTQSLAPSPFDAVLTVESLDAGLAGNLYGNGAALYFSFDPDFTVPLDAGPAGSLYGVCYPCQSSGDDGGAAGQCSEDADCCEGNCVMDAGSTGVCQ